MTDLQKEIEKTFGNRLRLRVCGICIEQNKILLIKHHSLGEKGILWAPPGGGVSFGENAETSLMREFKEETGLDVRVSKFLFVHEFLNKPLHALELFFEVKITGGKMSKGSDPEMSKENQIIHDLKYFSFSEIKKEDPAIFHNILNLASDNGELLALNGYFKFEKHP
ncbi:MAG: NUDIX domain-containing protein [Cytophagaceae bacterium]|nr:NUDIX domain-containing protein [Cytophagaceae bacterium]